jgi:hypothetical protein
MAKTTEAKKIKLLNYDVAKQLRTTEEDRLVSALVSGPFRCVSGSLGG